MPNRLRRLRRGPQANQGRAPRTVLRVAKTWWQAFEQENKHRPALILRLIEELAARNASMSQFFLAYVYSNTDNI